MTNTSTYEAWVSALRRWADNPGTNLRDLPILDVDSFTPGTYKRLISHLQTAISDMMCTWQAQLARQLSAAHDDHSLSRALIGLRATLARRLELARHPAFPVEISRALWDSAAHDIRQIQSTLEENIVRPLPGAARASASQERQMQLIRQHSFAALLDPSFPLNELFGSHSSPGTASRPHNVHASDRDAQQHLDDLPTHRRVLLN